MRSLLLVFSVSLAWAAEPVSWARSPEAFIGSLVTVHLNTGTRIAGHWTSVTLDEFTMKVEQTSNKKAIRKGLRTIPRSAIGEVRVAPRRSAGRHFGRAAGITVGFMLLYPLAMQVESSAVLALPVATTLLGNTLGKAFDERSRPVVFVD